MTIIATSGKDRTGALASIIKHPQNRVQSTADRVPSDSQLDAVEAPESRLRVCDMNLLGTSELTPPSYVVDPLIPRNHVTLFGGHGGSGKSTVALTLGAHVACGRKWADLDVSVGRVLYVSFEDDQMLVLWRLRNIAQEYALHLGTIKARMTVIDATEAKGIMCEVSEGGIRKILPTDDGEELIQMIREQQFDLVIIDNASDGYEGDENSRRQVRSFIRYLANSVREHHGAVLLLAHVDKTAARFGSGKNTYSGSTGWHNSARSRLALVDGELFQEKLNVGKALGVPIPLGWTPQAVPVPSGSSGAASARLLREEADDLAIMACFRAASEAGQVVPSAATGPSTVWHVLSAYPELPTSLKRDKSRLKEGIARLRRSGKLRAETYRNHQRNLRERLLLADDSDSSVCVSDL